MILSKNFYKTSNALRTFLLSRRMRSFFRNDKVFSTLSLVEVKLPQFFFYSTRLKTVPRFSGNLQLLSNWKELESLPVVCPTNAIKVSQKSIEIDSERCIACGLCVESSPEGLLLMGIRDPEKKSPPAS